MTLSALLCGTSRHAVSQGPHTTYRLLDNVRVDGEQPERDYKRSIGKKLFESRTKRLFAPYLLGHRYLYDLPIVVVSTYSLRPEVRSSSFLYRGRVLWAGVGMVPSLAPH